MMTAKATCEVLFERDGLRLGVRVSGELDAATSAPLDTLVDELDPGIEELVVDLDGVTFLDSSGLRALLRLHTDIARHPGGEPEQARSPRAQHHRARRAALPPPSS